ncbi:MAG: cell wall-binding repeat-containing protein [Coriobacteriia bacterium]
MRARSAILAVTLFAAVAIFIQATPACAAVVPMTVEEMSRSASRVVVVDCVSVTPRAVDPGAGPRAGIVTDVRFAVTDVLAGTAAPTLAITQPGGAIGGLVLEVSEVPRFAPGARYVLFVTGDGAVMGGRQGVLSVRSGRIGPAGETLSSLERRVRAARGDAMTFAEALASALTDRAAHAAEAITPLAAPVISSITPTNQSAGTQDQVVIGGTGFGATRGTGAVRFYKTSTSVVTGVVASWSDTQIVCEVPQGAGSGAVTVVNDGGSTSAGYTYDVGFSYGGLKWHVLSETYRVNANTADTGGELAMVQAAANSWSTVSDFAFAYGGTCASTVNPVTGIDGNNDVYWASSGFSSSGILAWNAHWHYEASDELIESDIVFNDAYTWGDGSSGSVDTQSVALHEMGHSLNLSDQYGPGDSSSAKVMYGMMPAGVRRRSLSADDIAGARWIYGFGGDTAAPVLGTLSSSTHPSDTTWYASDDPLFQWSATDTSALSYSYVIDHTAGTLPDTTAEGTGTSMSYSNLADGEWYFHVRAGDSVGNWASTALHRRVRIDDTRPTGTFSLNGGDSSTDSLVASVDSAVSGAVEMRIAPDGVVFGSWVAYAAIQSVTLPDGVGTKTVAVEYRDLAGNTLALKDTISYDPDVRVFSSEEIAGADRYATAIRVSQATFADGDCDAVIIATGGNYPDALGAGGLAGAVHGPVLLVPSTGGLPTAVRAEILRLTQGRSPRTAYIVGGTSVVSSKLESNLKTLVGTSVVKRLGGADRFATANLVAREVVAALSARGDTFSGEAFVVTGMAFPDALLVSPIAYARQRPVLLVNKSVDTNLRATIAAAGITDIDVVGSTSTVPSTIVTSLDAIGGVNAVRVASGADRYAMSVAVAEWACANEGFTTDYAGIATGDNFPDALAAGPMQGEVGSLLLLTPSTSLDSRIRSELVARYAETRHVRFLGGLVAVSQNVRDAVIAALD